MRKLITLDSLAWAEIEENPLSVTSSVRWECLA